ncbi:MAG TPA: tetratricopeptide repeat protein [Streptosporangiaceae bacterium]|nr:tetratricopeptide repeat protein [Streptosporangiaceae bacterium]
MLGPIELLGVGRQLDLGSVKVRCALAVLVLNLSAVVSADVLIDRLWDGDPPPKARESLSVYITRLRKVLRQAADDRVRLVARAHGYLLDADPVEVDVHLFRSLRRQATGLARRGERERARSLLDEADALWRGQALAGLPGASIARVRQSLEEERRAAMLERIELDMALGRHMDLVGELHRLSDLYPMDEAIAACLMTALYRSGRQSDALSVYRNTRHRLISEMAAEPGAALSALHQRILRRDPDLDVTPVARSLAVSSTRDTLPPDARDFVGRAEEMDVLTAYQGSATVQVITGMPGVGKTALSVRAARVMSEHYPDGHVFLSFCTYDPRNPPLAPAGAVHRLLRMLDIPADRIPQPLAERAALWRAELARRRLMIVFDDVADLDQIRPLLPAAGACRVLVTSRTRLDVPGATAPLTLAPLAIDDAIELFTRVAGPARLRNDDEVTEAVRLCGGLPLAIQLTARRLRADRPVSASDLVEELSQPAVWLAGADGPESEILAAFVLSYRALPARVRQFFRRLGLHPGTDITVCAAAALGGVSLPETETALAVLRDRHLIEAAGPCFRFHDLIRRYAGACASREDPGRDRSRAFDRLLDYYLYSADRADGLLYPRSRRLPAPPAHDPAVMPDLDTPARATEWMELEWRNILHAAHRAAEHERKKRSADLIRTLAAFLEAAGHWSEAAAAHALALQACRDLDDAPGIALASVDLSLVLGRVRRHQEALRHAERAAAIYQSLGDQSGHARALDQIGTLHRFAARFRAALAHHQEAGELFQAAGDSGGVASALNHTGIACYHLGRYEDAQEHLKAALALYRRAGDRRGEAKTLNNMGNMQLHRGLHRDALRSYHRALEIFLAIGGERNQAILYENIGSIQQYKRNYDDALVSYRRSLAISRRIGNLAGEAGTRNEIGATLSAMDRYADALVHHQRAERIAQDLGDPYERVIALRGIAEAHRGQGRHDQALDHYQQALLLARAIGEPYQEGKILDGIAETVQQTEGPGPARIYWHQALDVYQQLNVPEAETVRIRLDPPPPDRRRS